MIHTILLPPTAEVTLLFENSASDLKIQHNKMRHLAPTFLDLTHYFNFLRKFKIVKIWKNTKTKFQGLMWERLVDSVENYHYDVCIICSLENLLHGFIFNQ
jgi:hypothetical protein